MNPESFFGPVAVIAVLLACFFVAMAYLRHLGVQRARTRQLAPDAKPWPIADPYTASEKLTAAPSPATLTPPAAPQEAASDPSRPVFRQFNPVAKNAPKPDASASGYVWE